MAEARQYNDWAQTSEILALTANCNRDPKKQRPFKAIDINPFAANLKKDKQTLVNLAAIKAIFVRKK